MTDPHARVPAPARDHDRHDLLLVSALAAGDVEARDRARAELQVAACAACTELHADLIAIAMAAATLPDPARPRDFTLTRDDAARLRRPSLRRLFVDVFGPRGVVGRPLATGVTTLGVVGVIVASSAGIFGGAAAGPAALGTAGAPASTHEAAVEGAPTNAPAQDTFSPGGPKSSDPGQVFAGSESTRAPALGGPDAPVPGQDAQGDGGNRSTDTAGDDLRFGAPEDRTGPLLAISLGLVALGLALFALRRVAARIA